MEIGILYYSSSELDGTEINEWCKETIRASGLPITSITQLPTGLGDNYIVETPKGYTRKSDGRIGRSHTILYETILQGLNKAPYDYVFFCEHDVLYHPSHFEFRPKKDNVYYYDNTVCKYRTLDRKVVSYDCHWLSQLCAGRELLIDHYETRLDILERGKKAYGYEPGTGQSQRIDDHEAENWESPYYSIDVRHGENWTGVKRMDPSEFRDKSTCENFQELDVNDLEGWDIERLLSL